jgi:hypothetical protein
LEYEFSKGIIDWADLGCGSGEFLSLIGVVPERGFAVDVVRPIFLHQNFIFQEKDVNLWLRETSNNKFDLISMFELVEHFVKKEALDLISSVEGKSRAVLISTPSGFLKQDAQTHQEYTNNPWQWHKSGFSTEEFVKMGFFVFVLKNYHLWPVGNNKSFDALLCYKKEGHQEKDYFKLRNYILRKNIFYNSNPLRFYRTLRSIWRFKIYG